MLGIDGATLRFQDPQGEDRDLLGRLHPERDGPGAGRRTTSGWPRPASTSCARGVRTNDQGRPTCPACGPAATSPAEHMLAHVATREGIVAVNSMFGRPDRMRYDAIPAVIYTHPEVASVGAPRSS